jgi:hypothetical protein
MIVKGVLFVLAMFAAGAVNAADCYWAGGTSSDWATSANWTTTARKPTNDGAFFKSDQFSDRFKNDNYVVTFSSEEVNYWRTFFNNCGTAQNPIILRATDSKSGLTTGSTSNNKDVEGFYIGTNLKNGTGSAEDKAGEGDAYVRFENGTFKTGSWSNWWIGNQTYAGHVVAVNSTIEVGHQFRLYCGSFTATNVTFIAKNSNSYIGDSKNKIGTMKLVDSEATFSGAEMIIGSREGSMGELIVESGKVTCGKWIDIGYEGKAQMIVGGGKNAATLTCSSEDIIFGSWYLPDAATNSVTVKSGGTISVRGIRYHNGNSGEGKSMAHFVFDGGTLKLQSTSDLVFHSDNSNQREACAKNPVALSKKLKVYVTANGGTIDTQGKLLTSPIPFEDAPNSVGGGMTFKGGGVFTNEVDSSYTGKTTIELGTQLFVPTVAGFGGGIAVSFSSSTQEEGIYTIATLTGNETISSTYLDKIVAPEGCSFKLINGGKSIICIYGTPKCVWIGGGIDNKFSTAGNWLVDNVPIKGETTPIYIYGSGTIQNDIEGLTPSSITFGPLLATATIEGESFSSLKAVTNLTTASVNHRFNAPVAFSDKILVVQGAMSWEQKNESSIRFAGGITGTTFAEGTARYLNGFFSLSTGKDWVARTYGNNDRWGITADSSLTLPSATETYELALGDSSISGGAFTTSVMQTSARLLCWNVGEYVVTNELTVTLPNADKHLAHGYNGGSGGNFKFEKITLGDKGTDKWFYFANDGDVSSTRYVYIGAGGLNFVNNVHPNTAYSCGLRTGDIIYLRPWHSDYSISTKLNARTDLVVYQETHFGTVDEDGVARTVTCNAQIRNLSSGKAIVEGSGTFVVKSPAFTESNKDSGTWTVTDTATLALTPNGNLGIGTATVNSGATLALLKEGTVTLTGALSLESGSTLSFKVLKNESSVLDMNSKTLTLPASGKVKVKLTTDSLPMLGKSYTLISNTTLTDEDLSKFELADGISGTLSVVNGNLVYTAPTYFYISVR